MATLKVSAMDAETDFDYDDLLYLVRGGDSRKIGGTDFRKAVFDPRYAKYIFDDFLVGPTISTGLRNFGQTTSNFSVGLAVSPIPTGTVGVAQYSASGTGSCWLVVGLFDTFASNAVRSCFTPSTIPIICEWRINISDAPSATNPIYYFRVGMRSIPSYNTNTASCHGVWAELYWNGSAQVWKLVAEVASSKTSVDASVGITANTWHRVTVVYTTSNAYLFLDGTQIASLDTGLPTEAAAPMLVAVKTSGTAIVVQADYVWAYQPTTNGR